MQQISGHGYIDDTQISDQWYNESTESDMNYDNDINIGGTFTTTGSGRTTTNWRAWIIFWDILNQL